MLTVAGLLEELQLMPPESLVEVWYPADGRGAYDVDVDVKLQAVHDDTQIPVAIAVVAGRPLCRAEVAGDECGRPADIELTDRTGHRHPLCGRHAEAAPGVTDRITAAYGGPGAPSWAVAGRLLADRWGDHPDVVAWLAHPAPWNAPLPQPEAGR